MAFGKKAGGPSITDPSIPPKKPPKPKEMKTASPDGPATRKPSAVKAKKPFRRSKF